MAEALVIQSMAYKGAGVARSQEGKAVFVDGAVVGDIIKPRALRSLPSFDRCEGYTLLEPSPKRLEAMCPYAEACGGCPWQVLAYDEQLHWKRQFVVDALQRIGRLEHAETLVEACVPSPSQWHYRNKIELYAFTQSGKVGLGLHKKESHEHVRTDSCLLLHKALSALPGKLAGALSYCLKESSNELKRVAIRSSLVTRATEVALVMLPSGVNRGLLSKVLNENARLSSLVRVITEGEMAERRVKQVEVLSGAGYWHEELLHNSYKVSAPSFFQINSPIAESMLDKLAHVLDGLPLDSSAAAADLYSGVGTFTLPLAGRFKRVSAIESYGSSIRDLRRNLEEAGIEAHVIGGDVARELSGLDPVELALIDPPRSGLRPEALNALLEYQAPNLIYVSCNPSTLARDIALLISGGYSLISATPFDQFPQSYHVEVMALLRT